jgi:hypothetical protein
MTRFVAVVLFGVILVGPCARADESSEQLERRVAEAVARLDLSVEQVDRVTPVLKDSIAAQQRILSRYGIDLESGKAGTSGLGLGAARSMRQELDAVREKTLSALESLLTETQHNEFKRMQEERRAEIRERVGREAQNSAR